MQKCHMTENDFTSWFDITPTIAEAKMVLNDDIHLCEEHIENKHRSPRSELFVPATIQTARGRILNILTLNISQFGIGILHRGIIQPDQDVTITMQGDKRVFEYRVRLIWTLVCSDGLWKSGGKFLSQTNTPMND